MFVFFTGSLNTWRFLFTHPVDFKCCISFSCLRLKDLIHKDYVRGLNWNQVNASLWSSGWDGKVLEHKLEKEVMETE